MDHVQSPNLTEFLDDFVGRPNGFTSVLEWTEGDRITLSTEWALAAEGGKVSARLTTPFHGYKLQTVAALYTIADSATDARVRYFSSAS